MPGAVWDEVLAGGPTDPAARNLPLKPWLTRVDVAAIDPNIAAWNLGLGESEVLSLASSLGECRAMIDDAAARACARTVGARIIGTGGALILAKRRGLISSVGEALQSLRDVGFWLSPDIERLLKTQAGE